MTPQSPTAEATPTPWQYFVYGVVILAVPAVAFLFLGMPGGALFADVPDQGEPGVHRIAQGTKVPARGSFASLLRNWEYTTHCVGNPGASSCGDCLSTSQCGPTGVTFPDRPACCVENGGLGDCPAACQGCCNSDPGL